MSHRNQNASWGCTSVLVASLLSFGCGGADQPPQQETRAGLSADFAEARTANAEKLYFLSSEQIARLGRLNGGSSTLQPPEAWAWVKEHREGVFEDLREFCSGVDECRYPQCSSIHTFVGESEGERPPSSRSIDPRHGTPLFSFGGQCAEANAQNLEESAAEGVEATALLAKARAALLEYLDSGSAR